MSGLTFLSGDFFFSVSSNKDASLLSSLLFSFTLLTLLPSLLLLLVQLFLLGLNGVPLVLLHALVLLLGLVLLESLGDRHVVEVVVETNANNFVFLNLVNFARKNTYRKTLDVCFHVALLVVDKLHLRLA